MRGKTPPDVPGASFFWDGAILVRGAGFVLEFEKREYRIMKKISLLLAVAGAAFVFFRPYSARATDWTLLIVPVRYSVLQVAFDVIQKRPVVLVSYQGDASESQPALHVWNGEEWRPISQRDLAEVRFLQVIPQRVIAVGDASTLPPSILQATNWCPQVVGVEEMDTPELINAFGKSFRFTRDEWAWFAARYGLQIEDQNAARRSFFWFERTDAPPPRPRIPLFRRSRSTPPAPAIRGVPPAQLEKDFTSAIPYASSPLAGNWPFKVNKSEPDKANPTESPQTDPRKENARSEEAKADVVLVPSRAEMKGPQPELPDPAATSNEIVAPPSGIK